MKNSPEIDWATISGGLTLAVLVWAVGVTGAFFAQAQTYTVLYSFKGGLADGMNPEAGLFMDEAGNLYGTTVNGPKCYPTPCTALDGIAFELSPTAQETKLHHFAGSPDGASPYGGLAAYPYGTTAAGGTSNMGAVFELGAHKKATIMHSFTGPPGDGAFPYAGLVRDSAGNLYGTTSAGGASDSGVVFKLDGAGRETVLYSFTGGADGGVPYGSLIQDPAGNLYGTTSAGGVTTGNCFPSGCGVVFMLNAAGQETVLYSFAGSPADGAYPYAGLVLDSANNLYGTTFNGGAGACTDGCGVVFEVNPSSLTATVLYSFTGSPADGAFPYAGVIRDSAGNLYGTTTYGGAAENGVVFKLDMSGTETVLYSFTGGADGGVPRAPLTIDSIGNLYGTTYFGGVQGRDCGKNSSDSCGVVFKLEP